MAISVNYGSEKNGQTDNFQLHWEMLTKYCWFHGWQISKIQSLTIFLKNMLMWYNYTAVFYNKGIEYTIFKNKLDISRKKNQQPFTLKWNVQFYNFFNTIFQNFRKCKSAIKHNHTLCYSNHQILTNIPCQFQGWKYIHFVKYGFQNIGKQMKALSWH